MPKKQQCWSEGLRARPAGASHRRRPGKRIQPQRAIGLLLGAALSVGGVSQAFDGVRFFVKKDLGKVGVTREDRDRGTAAAGVDSTFTANSMHRPGKLFPGGYVSERSNLFGDHFLWRRAGSETENSADVFDLIDDEIRRQFFSSEIPFGRIIHQKAQKYDVDPALVAAVVEAESEFRRKAHSDAGAVGLMQLTPQTGRWMGARNLYDADQNVDAGVKYLKYLELRFDGNLKKTIAAYNAGEGTVRRYDGVPPYRETRTYVKRVMRNYEKRKSQLDDLSATPDDAPAKTADASIMTRTR